MCETQIALNGVREEKDTHGDAHAVISSGTLRGQYRRSSCPRVGFCFVLISRGLAAWASAVPVMGLR